MKVDKVFNPEFAHDINFVTNWARSMYTENCEKLNVNELEELIYTNRRLTIDFDSDPLGYRIFIVDSYTGSEGGGEDCWMTLAIAKEGSLVTNHHESKEVEDAICYIQTTGFYSSYEGTEWHNEWKFVKPKIVTKVLYT